MYKKFVSQRIKSQVGGGNTERAVKAFIAIAFIIYPLKFK